MRWTLSQFWIVFCGILSAISEKVQRTWFDCFTSLGVQVSHGNISSRSAHFCSLYFHWHWLQLCLNFMGIYAYLQNKTKERYKSSTFLLVCDRQSLLDASLVQIQQLPYFRFSFFTVKQMLKWKMHLRSPKR